MRCWWRARTLALQFTCEISPPQRYVLELDTVIKNKESLWGKKMGVENRCTYVAGDMFDDVPTADAYIMKMILHDWSDDECIKILSNIYRRVSNGGTVFIAEHMVPGPEKPHFQSFLIFI